MIRFCCRGNKAGDPISVVTAAYCHGARHAAQPPSVVAQPPLNSPGLSCTKTIRGGSLDGHEFTEADFAGGSLETLDERWTFTMRRGELKVWSVERQPYAKGKVDAEMLCYSWGAEHGIDVITSNPCHVLGPLFGKSQNTGWQARIGAMIEGKGAHEGRPRDVERDRRPRHRGVAAPDGREQRLHQRQPLHERRPR
eukprot:COSAG06_NODE_1567_length_9085_cov_3.404073_11_plen_196_part_00